MHDMLEELPTAFPALRVMHIKDSFSRCHPIDPADYDIISDLVRGSQLLAMGISRSIGHRLDGMDAPVHALMLAEQFGGPAVRECESEAELRAKLDEVERGRHVALYRYAVLGAAAAATRRG